MRRSVFVLVFFVFYQLQGMEPPRSKVEGFEDFGNDTVIDIQVLQQKISNDREFAKELLRKAGVKNVSDQLADICSERLNADEQFSRHFQYLRTPKEFLVKKIKKGPEQQLLDLLKDMAKDKYIESLQGLHEKTDELANKLEKEGQGHQETIAQQLSTISKQKKCTIGTVLGAGVLLLLNTSSSWGPVVIDAIKGFSQAGNSTAT